MSPDEIMPLRLHNQRLRGTPFATIEDVLRWQSAVQAQEFAYAKWSLAQRAQLVTAEVMDRAFAEGRILRTHLLRPTWHFVLPEDARWIIQLSRPRVNALNAFQYRQQGLDDDVLTRTSAVLAQAVDDGQHHTRDELARALAEAGIEASGTRLACIVMRAELDMVLISGTPRGKKHTYAAFDNRVPAAATPFNHDDALAELAQRYFTSRGPAALKDFMRWSRLTAADVKRGMEAVQSMLTKETIEGQTYWMQDAPGPRVTEVPRADLVQGYDEIVMSYSESKHHLFDSDPTVAPPDVRPRYLHAILINGKLAGHWRHAISRDGLQLESYWHRSISDSESQAVQREVERYGQYWTMNATLS
jgi:hypothetical protein